MRSSTSTGTFFSSEGLKGPPGMACIMKNATVISTTIVNTPASRRLNMYFSMVSLPIVQKPRNA